MFCYGTTVKLIRIDGMSQPPKVFPGATADVVEPHAHFLQDYNKLSAFLNHDPRLIDEFIWVFWDRNNQFYQGADDGAYHEFRFILDKYDEDDFLSAKTDKSKRKEEEPKDNQGRYPGKCWWCKTQLVEIPGISTEMFHVCPKCKK